MGALGSGVDQEDETLLVSQGFLQLGALETLQIFQGRQDEFSVRDKE